MKKSIIFLGLLATGYVYAQTGRVGVNTDSPKATMDISPNSTNARATATTNEGLLIPRLTKIRLNNIAVANLTESTLVYVNDFSGASNARTVDVTSKGFYYYSTTDSKWVKLAVPNDIAEQDLRLVGKNNHITQDAGNGANGTSVGTGVANVAIGPNAMLNNTTGHYNVGIGEQALKSNLGGHSNVAIGKYALQANTSGIHNIAIGISSLDRSTNGHYNIAMGEKAIYRNTSGSSNIGIGISSLSNNTTGQYNIALGTLSLENSVQGDRNVAIGNSSGRWIKGNSNVHIGSYIVGNNTATELDNVIAIGNGIDIVANPLNNTTGLDNTIILGHDNRSGAPRIGMGTYKPQVKLHIEDATDHKVRLQAKGQSTFTDFVKRPNDNFLIVNRNRSNNWSGHIVINGTTGFIGLGEEVGSAESPRAQLEVSGGVRARIGHPASGNTSNAGYAFGGNGDSGMFYTDTASNTTDSGILRLYNDGSLFSSMWTNATTKQRITRFDGRIGVGTSTPSEVLDVYGNIRATDGNLQTSISGSADGVGGRIDIINPDKGVVGAKWTIYNMYAKKTASYPNGRYKNGLQFWNYPMDNTSWHHRITFSDDGKIGIGTQEPEQSLHSAGAFLLVNGAGNERAYIGGDGAANDVQIGSMNAGISLITAWNTATGTSMRVQGTQFVNTSDARLKEQVTGITNATDTLLKLKPVNYYWKNKTQGKELQYGFIAQDIEKVLPDIVNTDKKGYKSVSYTSVIPILVKSIQEKEEENKALKKQVEDLAARLDALEKKLNK